MKIQAFFLLLLISFISTANAADEWYPFVIPEKLDPDSPANIGKFVLDAPAGKHGFVKIKDGHFYFEDGTRAKFWGTNLCFSSCFPSKGQAEIIANRLAFFGFNAVRLHHMDFYFEPEGIFKDDSPDINDDQKKKTWTFSEEQLDRLDYLMYQLKIRGIYIDINLLVSRQFTVADGIIDAHKLPRAAKPLSMFDPKIIDLQKKYAKDLLTHYNKYTLTKYCDEPAVALIEITNENSMFSLNRGSAPPYYLKEIDHRWSKWPKEKYPTEEEARKSFYINIEKEYIDEMLSFLHKDCGIKVPITGIGGYYKSEEAKALINCDFLDVHAYWDHPRFPYTPWDKNNFRIGNGSMLTDKRMGLIGDILMLLPPDNIKPRTITEWNHCYPNVYAYETPVLMAIEAMENKWDGLFQFDFSSHIREPLNINNIDNYFDIISNTQQLILTSLGSMLYLKEEGAKVRLDNGALAFSSATVSGIVGFINKKPMVIGDFTVSTGQNGAVVFLKKTNGYLLASVSEVKNTNSGWNWFGKFEWGNPPVLLKKMNLKILSAKKILKVYELDENGSRKMTLPIDNFVNGSLFSTDKSDKPWFEIITQ